MTTTEVTPITTEDVLRRLCHDILQHLKVLKTTSDLRIRTTDVKDYPDHKYIGRMGDDIVRLEVRDGNLEIYLE